MLAWTTSQHKPASHHSPLPSQGARRCSPACRSHPQAQLICAFFFKSSSCSAVNTKSFSQAASFELHACHSAQPHPKPLVLGKLRVGADPLFFQIMAWCARSRRGRDAACSPGAVSGCGVPWAGGCCVSLGSGRGTSLCHLNAWCSLWSTRGLRSRHWENAIDPSSCAWPCVSVVPFSSHAAASRSLSASETCSASFQRKIA